MDLVPRILYEEIGDRVILALRLHELLLVIDELLIIVIAMKVVVIYRICRILSL